MIIEKADKKDLPKILEIQYMAFRKEAEDFNDFEIEPLKQTLDALYEINSSIRCPQNIILYERLVFVRFRETRTENNGFVYLQKII